MLTLIAAVAQNMAIGNAGKLLYWLPNDLKRFKALTTGHTIIMGRKTFESLPKGALPNRRNVVLTRSERHFEGCDVYASLNEALRSCSPTEEVYVIGGASVYAEALPLADRLCLTHIDHTPSSADAFFPPVGPEWHVTADEPHTPDERHAHPYRFTDYERRK